MNARGGALATERRGEQEHLRRTARATPQSVSSQHGLPLRAQPCPCAGAHLRHRSIARLGACPIDIERVLAVWLLAASDIDESSLVIEKSDRSEHAGDTDLDDDPRARFCDAGGGRPHTGPFAGLPVGTLATASDDRNEFCPRPMP